MDFKRRKKSFSNVVKFIKKNPTIPLSTGMLALSAANLGINLENSKKSKESEEKQLATLSKLTDALNKVDDTMKTVDSKASEQKKDDKVRTKRRRLFSNTLLSMKNFRQKDFGIRSGALTGAVIGTQIGAIGTRFLPKGFKLGKVENNAIRDIIITAGTTLVGAALGAISGVVSKVEDKVSKPNRQLMSQVLTDLKKTGFKVNEDYVIDPKRADQMRTRVCLVITKSNGDLRILINTISDRKLEELSNRIVKNIPNSSVANTSANTRYNEVTISTISDSSADAGLIVGISAQFIRSGYPVYLVEVGG